jgi:hypothetical protein
MGENGIGKHDQVLAGLVWSLQAAAMQQLGKIKNPLTDVLERDLAGARGTIDILEMLKVKCRQDTAPEVLRLLDGAVMELQMNYLEELGKEREAPASEGDAPEGGGPADGAPAGDEDTAAGEGPE